MSFIIAGSITAGRIISKAATRGPVELINRAVQSITSMLRVIYAGVLAAPIAFALAMPLQAQADPTNGPCTDPTLAAVVDRPGTGRTTTNGGAPCVVPVGELVVENGYRRQITIESNGFGSSKLASISQSLFRIGIAKRIEVGVTPPANETRAAFGLSSFDAARGLTDVALEIKYLVANSQTLQGSVGIAYSAPTGTSEFTAGAPTFAFSANAAVAISSRLSLSTTQIVGTSTGQDAVGLNRSFLVFSPSFTLAYALDSVDMILIQNALSSRQSPVTSSGSRGFIALQRSIGPRLVFDIESERNLAPLGGRSSWANGIGIAWTAIARHPYRQPCEQNR